jgi:sulfate permease, SulP family
MLEKKLARAPIAFGLNANYAVEVVGKLPQGLPAFSAPRVPFSLYLAMILPAIGVLLVAYREALRVAREFAERHGYEINPDQELNGHGVANLASAFLGA